MDLAVKAFGYYFAGLALGMGAAIAELTEEAGWGFLLMGFMCWFMAIAVVMSAERIGPFRGIGCQ